MCIAEVTSQIAWCRRVAEGLLQGQWEALRAVPRGCAACPAVGQPLRQGCLVGIVPCPVLEPQSLSSASCLWHAGCRTVPGRLQESCDLSSPKCVFMLERACLDANTGDMQAKHVKRGSLQVCEPTGVWLNCCGLCLQKPLGVLTGCH